ncbi:DUF349 domain-containing protein [Saccharospirillum impatiens]|uniref:DUF349 domain-containing protein n=1 Tax=Saccharospirillum impatiens TaxID=169438 RepID=UPI00041D7BC9|nr:DUF349 domain-containing protein [Saccharospirillum impatiens]
MVLSKFFGKKTTPAKPASTTPGRRRVDPPAAGMEQWLGQVQASDPKQRKEAMVELARAMDTGQLTMEHRQQMPAAEQLALSLHVESPLSDVSEALWVEVACYGFSARVRIAAAENVTGIEALEQLLKHAKGRDKAVYRLVKTQLEEHKQAHQALQAREDHTRRLVEQLERHAKAPVDPLYSGKLRALQEQWSQNSPYADDALTGRWQQAILDAEARRPVVPDTVDHEAPAPETDQALQEAADARETDDDIEADVDIQPESEQAVHDPVRTQLIQHLWQDLKDRLDQSDIDPTQVREAMLYLTEQQHHWRQTEQLQPANREEERAFHQLCTTYETSLNTLARLIDRHGPLGQWLPAIEADPAGHDALAHGLDEWLHSLDWPQGEPEPEIKPRVERAVQMHHDQLAEHRKQGIQAVRQARGLIQRCQGAVNDGHLKRASGLLQGVRDAVVNLKPEEHHGLFRQFEETEQAVEKLRDWQSFAVLPKKEALIERMRHLLGQSLPPEDRARQIREMQDEWRMLSRGLQSQHQELWEAFHDLAQKAYEPCKVFFEEQGKLRTLNLHQRQALAEQLGQYEQLIKSKGLDLKELDRVLTLARNDWRRFSPVDRAANKSVQAEFNAVFQRLRDRLQDEQQVFREAKLAIIEQARALLDEPDSRQATDTAKQLQRDWQQAGHLARRDEQALWKSFRAICDELFARREAAADAFKADLNAHKAQADAILAGMEALLAEHDPLAAKERFDDLKRQYSDLGTLPKADYKKLQDRFERFNQDFQSRRKDIKAQQQDQHWQALFNWNRHARFECDSADAAQLQWQALDKIPAPASKLVSSLPQWQAPVPEDEPLRRKTVELEILARSDTPEDDKTLRMALQVQRLTDGLGQQVSQSDVDQAVVAWLATPARDKAQFDALLARMKQARRDWMMSV